MVPTQQNKYFGLASKLALLFLALFLAYKNFTTGTWLTGWDNLHPEFNLPLNIQRSLFAAWQEYQGVGLPGGMAHAADLPRQLVLWVLSSVFPAHLLRYVWTFLMLTIGPLGVFYLTGKLLRGKKDVVSILASFAAGAFYLFNLATVQVFFIPYEAFVSFYGFLPWLLFYSLSVLQEKRGAALKYFAVSLVAASAFYVQTLFVVYVLVLTFFVLANLFGKRKGALKSGLKLAFLTLAANSFWLLPAVYFTATNSSVLIDAQINRIATPETQLFNEARTNLADVALLKGFWFDYYDFDGQGFDYLMPEWTKHLVGRLDYVGYALFGVSVLGILASVFTKGSKWSFAVLAGLIFSVFMLFGENGASGAVFSYVSDKLPLFSQVFRSVFTKISVPAALFYAIGIGFFVNLWRGKLSFKKISPLFMAGTIFLGALHLVKPAFDGNLVSERMRQEIPQEYFDAFSYLNQKEMGRVAVLPAHTFWGWHFHEWGGNGSGFIWYGIKHPILDRAFDVWSSYNETFYNEISYAIYSGNRELFSNVLEKYQIRYLFLDDSIVNAGGSESALGKDAIRNFLDDGLVVSEKSFGGVSIFETPFGRSFVTTSEEYIFTDLDGVFINQDTVFATSSAYVKNSQGTAFPFINFDERQAPEVRFKDGFVELVTSPLNFPNEKEIIAPEDLTVSVDDSKRLTAAFEGAANKVSLGENRPDYFRNCDLKEKGGVEKEVLDSGVLYRASGGGIACEFFALPELEYENGYILKIKGENLSGRALKIYLVNWENERVEKEIILSEGLFEENVFLLPKGRGGSGYSLTLETRSFGKVSSENIVESVEIVAFPYDLLTQVRLVPNEEELRLPQANNLVVKNTQKVGTSHYFVDTEGEGLLVLGQGYEEGWKAYSMQGLGSKTYDLKKWFPWWFGEELGHEKVNSWANGWMVPEGVEEVIIVFWPQYLEWGGLVVLVFTLFFLIKQNGPQDKVLSNDNNSS